MLSIVKRWPYFRLIKRTFGSDVYHIRSNEPSTVEDNLKRFDDAFPIVVDYLTTNNNTKLHLALEHFKHLLNFNVPHGKKQRGLLTLTAYRMLTKQPTEKQLLSACITGWCVEMMQSASLIADDMMDHSLTRRGRPCWYLKENVGFSTAINDIYFLENAVYYLFEILFKHQHFYVDLLELFRKTAFSTVIGQALDLLYSKKPFEMFTMDNYNAIVQYKTSIYSFYLPIATAFYMAGAAEPQLLSKVMEICLQIGLLFQIQDDYLDCFGDPNISGKIGSDIKEGKCTWLIVKALQLLSEDDIKMFQTWHGKDDPELVKLVVNKYKELHLDKHCLKHICDLFQSINFTIQQLPVDTVLPEIFYFALKPINGRQIN